MIYVHFMNAHTTGMSRRAMDFPWTQNPPAEYTQTLYSSHRNTTLHGVTHRRHIHERIFIVCDDMHILQTKATILSFYWSLEPYTNTCLLPYFFGWVAHTFMWDNRQDNLKCSECHHHACRYIYGIISIEWINITVYVCILLIGWI